MGKQKISTPEAQGIPSDAIVKFIKRLEEQKIPMHSILIVRHGILVAELYYDPYGKNTLHRMFSETKSCVSLAIGLLEAEGRLSLNDKICDFFPEFLPKKIHPWLAEMTIENLLMMETCHNMTTYNKKSVTENWVESFFLTPPTHRPGTIFMYDTSASHTLGALVEKLTEQKLLDYLKDKVLREIDFSEESYVIPDPFGVSMGGTGLMAKPMDMMRVGLLLMNGGKHPDKYKERDTPQIYPKAYLDKALSFKTSTILNSGTDTGYGYQFWRLPYNGYAMLGMGNQDVRCFPEQDMVFAYTADTQGIPNGNEIIQQTIQTELFEKLSDIPLVETVMSQKVFCECAEKLQLPVLIGSRADNCQEKINRMDFPLSSNQQGFRRMKLYFSAADKGTFEYENESGVYQIPFGIGYSEKSIFPKYGTKCTTSAVWCDKDTFYIRTWLIDEEVASISFKLAFSSDNGLTVLMKKTEETRYNEFQGILNT